MESKFALLDTDSQTLKEIRAAQKAKLFGARWREGDLSLDCSSGDYQFDRVNPHLGVSTDS
jgi:hypothetical protein